MARFKKGQSGNPKGKPKGARDKRTALRELLQPHAPQLVAKAVELALEGDTTALRICVDRVIPALPAESPPVRIKADSNDVTKSGAAVLQQAFDAEISPSVAQQLLRSLHTQSQIVNIDEVVKRIEALEANLNAQRN